MKTTTSKSKKIAFKNDEELIALRAEIKALSEQIKELRAKKKELIEKKKNRTQIIREHNIEVNVEAIEENIDIYLEDRSELKDYTYNLVANVRLNEDLKARVQRLFDIAWSDVTASIERREAKEDEKANAKNFFTEPDKYNRRWM